MRRHRLPSARLQLRLSATAGCLRVSRQSACSRPSNWKCRSAVDAAVLYSRPVIARVVCRSVGLSWLPFPCVVHFRCLISATSSLPRTWIHAFFIGQTCVSYIHSSQSSSPQAKFIPIWFVRWEKTNRSVAPSQPVSHYRIATLLQKSLSLPTFYRQKSAPPGGRPSETDFYG